MDKDEDGVLSLKELKEGLLNRGIHLTDRTAKVRSHWGERTGASLKVMSSSLPCVFCALLGLLVH
jgi:hypothetical protein